MNILNIINDEINKFQLNETLTDIVYHFTQSNLMVNILKTNSFSLTAAVGSKSDLDVNSNRFFFFSTTRSKSTGYVRGNVKMVLDGNKLNSNYKSVPVDYWQYSKNPKDYINKNDYNTALKSNEQEDRIVSYKSEIPNAIKYIIAIHVEYKDDQNRINEFIDLIQYSKKYNIPIYFYANHNDWLNENKKGLIDINKIPTQKKDVNTYTSREYFDYTIASLIAFNDKENYQKIVDYLGDEKKIQHFNDELKKRTYNNFKIGAPYDYETNNVISSAIHNSRSNVDKDTKFLLNLLVSDMRKLKVNNINGYLEKKKWIGKKTLNDYKKDLYEYLENVMNTQYTDNIEYKFYKDIEVDGNYYNHTYNSPEVIKIVNDYVIKIKKYVAEKLFQENEYDTLKYSFKITDSINDDLNIRDAKLTDKLNITYSGYDNTSDYNVDLVEFLEYQIYAIKNNAHEKASELYSEYEKQKYS